MKFTRVSELFVDNSAIDGKGCFTQVKIEKGERFKFYVLPLEKPHAFPHHAFPFDNNHSCVVLSEFSYCNHSITPNFELVDVNKVERTLTFEALRDIPEYSELTIEYK